MTQRNSTLSHSYQGADVKSQQFGGQYNTTFGNGNGTEKSTSPAISKLLTGTNELASVDPMTYNIIKANLLSRGSSPRNAASMTLLIIDSAKLQGLSPMKLLEDLKSANITLPDDTMYMINMLSGSTTSSVGTAAAKKNSNSYKARYIRA